MAGQKIKMIREREWGKREGQKITRSDGGVGKEGGSEDRQVRSMGCGDRGSHCTADGSEHQKGV